MVQDTCKKRLLASVWSFQSKGSRLQPEKKGNAGPTLNTIPPIARGGNGFAEGRDSEPRILQRGRVGFQRSRLPGKTHPQAIALFGAFKALAAKVSVLDNKGGSGLVSGEMPAIGKRMHDRDNQRSCGSQHAPDFFQGRRHIFDVHQHVVGHDEIEASVRERQVGP